MQLKFNLNFEMLYKSGIWLEMEGKTLVQLKIELHFGYKVWFPFQSVIFLGSDANGVRATIDILVICVSFVRSEDEFFAISKKTSPNQSFISTVLACNWRIFLLVSAFEEICFRQHNCNLFRK